jgi:energy-coupling factor transporter ATP-binding protein EcfA2
MMHIARDLSGGEKQRVVLARQLAKEPFLLFADEPTGTLDPQTAHLVHSMLTEAAENNAMGMVVTSHFSQVIEEVADRALLLEEGKVRRSAPLLERAIAGFDPYWEKEPIAEALSCLVPLLRGAAGHDLASTATRRSGEVWRAKTVRPLSRTFLVTASSGISIGESAAAAHAAMSAQAMSAQPARGNDDGLPVCATTPFFLLRRFRSLGFS